MSNGVSNSSHKELHLGLVCYGGVSLAIYMHGMTKEIQHLVVASRAYQEDPTGENPFESGTAVGAYWDLIQTAEARQGVRTAVVVDVVSGTSAGGINGIMLAKALARNREQEPLTRLWFERGDVKQLVGGRWTQVRKGLGLLAGLVTRRKTKPPLEGNDMLRWLNSAFRDIDTSDRPTRSVPGLEELPSLVPKGQDLELFVTTTDYFGYTRNVVISDPRAVQEKRHRHVFRFSHHTPAEDGSEPGGGQFTPDYNVMLALAARATSALPGLFPPVTTEQLETVLGVPPKRREECEREFFPEYRLAEERLSHTYFVDGGVLDNKPFGHTLDAIAGKTAGVEVDRRLIYLEPDPTYKPPPEEAAAPSAARGALSALSSIASYEPILDDILAVGKHNGRIRRIREIVRDCRDEVLDLLDEVGAFDLDTPQDQLAELREEIQARVRKLIGRTETAHHLLRVHSVVDQFAWGVCDVCEYPPESNANAWARCVIRCWAESRDYLGDDADRKAQEKLLESFDLGYTRRRIQFVVQGVNRLYAELAAGERDRPSRAELDAAKRALQNELAVIKGMIWGHDLPDEEREGVGQLFRAPRFDFAKESLEENAARFLARPECREKLDGMVDHLGQHLAQRRAEVRGKLFAAFHGLTDDWPEDARKDVLMRYLGFPFWDALIYPIQALGEGGELDEVEIVRMSPEDATLLDPGPMPAGRTAAKVKGIGLGHAKAFLKREYRENDYLWGRLDAAERLAALLLQTERPDPKDVKLAFLAILAEEESRPLGTVRRTLARLREAAERL